MKDCCCGHSLKDHNKFNPPNKSDKGSDFVCLNPNCDKWKECDIGVKPKIHTNSPVNIHSKKDVYKHKEQPTSVESWEADFDKWFGHGKKGHRRFAYAEGAFKEVKDFIRQELSTATEEGGAKMNNILKAKKELQKELEELETMETKLKTKKESVSLIGKECPFLIGSCYLIRTVTCYSTGRIKAIVGQFLVLEDAAWVADTGSFRDAIMKGIVSEVEPVEDMYVNINSIVDAFPWKHELLRTQK